MKSAIDRFVEKYKINFDTDCWEWQASKIKGYGHFYMFRKGKVVSWLAHRWIYSMLVSPIPKGMKILHTCDNPSCINPDHLWVGTQKDNVMDMVQKGRHRA